MRFRKAAIIYVPNVGKRKKIKESSKILALIKKISVESPIFFETPSVENTHSFIYEKLLKKEFDVILVAGGDGLVSSVCNGLMSVPYDLRVPFLPLAMGSGNTFAEDLGIKSVKDAVRLIEKAKEPSGIDILKVNTEGQIYYCVNVLGGGFITDVTKLAEDSGKKWGAFTYIWAVVKALKKMSNYKIRLTDRQGKTIFQSSRSVLLSFNNNCKTGAAFKMAPDALIDDGVVDIVVLHDISRLEFFIGFLKLFNGEHIFCRGCEYFQADYVKVEAQPNLVLMTDGELFGKTPFEVEVIKNELKVALTLNS